MDWTSGGAGGIAPYSADGRLATWQQGHASIRLPLAPTNVERALLIWQGIDRISQGGDGVYDNNVIQVYGAAMTHLGYGPVEGSLIGLNDTANWGDGGSSTYVADVTPFLTGQGLQVGGLSAKPGHSVNGVSLIVIYDDLDPANDRDITINIGNQNRFEPIALPDFYYSGSNVNVQLHVADGQNSTDASLFFSNGLGQLEFPDSASFLDGNSVLYMGQSRSEDEGLWDIHNFDLSSIYTSVGATPESVDGLTMTLGPNSGDSLKWISLITDQPSVGNRAPVASSQRFEMEEDSGSIGGSFQATDSDGQPLRFEVLTMPNVGALELTQGNQGFVYRPEANFNGTVSFTFVAFDGQAYSEPATIDIEVTPVNDAPTLDGQVVQIAENSPVGLVVTTMVGSDIDGDALTYSIVSGNDSGAFVIDSLTGVVTVVNSLPLDFETTERFDLAIRVSDPGGLYDEALLQIQLTDLIEFIPVQLQAPATLSTADKSISLTILSSLEFNPSQVDIDTLQLSINDVFLELVRNKRGVPKVSFSDVNGDGVLDLIVSFSIPAGSLAVGEFHLRMEGNVNGNLFAGEASGVIALPTKGGKGNGGGGKPRR